MKKIYFLIFTILASYPSIAQVDTLRTKQLDEVVIKSYRFDVDRLPASRGTFMLGGKKNEVMNLANMNVNVTEKIPRQIFAKVPGLFVYDMDGAGNQTNISTRGLDPHRGWEFNTRENGIITNSDLYGYPASHYSMPLEAVERIELVRGTGSLQYGAQFGGMLNYVTKHPDSTRAVAFESINSMGSFGMLSTYNALSGTVGKFQYYTYFTKRASNGYRDNAHTDYDAQSLVLIYQPVHQVRLKAELSRSNYVYQIPGPLTDSMFNADPSQSTRARNYFNPEIYIPSLSLDWKLNDRTYFSWVVSAVLGDRNSVMFDKPATTPDAINPATLTYAPRQVDMDHFHSYTTELRLLHKYSIGNMASSVAGGIQLINNDLHRQQLGKGTTGSDYDMSLTEPGFGRDLHFKTKNIAFFLENNIKVLPGLLISPGLRMEMGESNMTGTITYYDPGNLPNTITHHFPLYGVSANYTVKENTNIYAGWSQAYRPVIFKDIIPSSTYEQIDKNLEDAFGYNLEVGYRGSLKSFRWDVGLFQLEYNNRLGTLSETNPDGTFYTFKTNIGNSVTNGVELFAEYNFRLLKNVGISVFTSTSFMDARYRDAEVRSGDNNVDVSGNKVECVPEWISRNGVTFKYREAGISFQYSYTAETFADALNTVTPSATGSVGLVPSYGLLDMTAFVRISNPVMLRLNASNVTNEKYFTKRPSFYPGPGVWSSDGRSVNLSVSIKI